MSWCHNNLLVLRKGREEREEEEGKKNVGKDYKWEGKGGRMEKGEEESCLWGKEEVLYQISSSKDIF